MYQIIKRDLIIYNGKIIRIENHSEDNIYNAINSYNNAKTKIRKIFDYDDNFITNVEIDLIKNIYELVNTVTMNISTGIIISLIQLNKGFLVQHNTNRLESIEKKLEITFALAGRQCYLSLYIPDNLSEKYMQDIENKLIDITTEEHIIITKNEYNIIKYTETIINEMTGKLLNYFRGDWILSKKSILYKYLNKKIFDSNITLIDNPFEFVYAAWGKYDFEGIKRKNIVLIKEGKVNDFLLNNSVSNFFKKPSNGRATVNNNKIITCPTNPILYVKNMGLAEPQKKELFNTHRIDYEHSTFNYFNGKYKYRVYGRITSAQNKRQKNGFIEIEGNIFDFFKNFVNFECNKSMKVHSLYAIV